MNRKSFLKILGSAAPILAANPLRAQKEQASDAQDAPFKFALPPYAISFDADSGYIVFATNKNSVGEVEVEFENGKKSKFYASSETAGIKHAGLLHAVKIWGYRPGETLKCKVSATEIIEYWARIDKIEGRFKMGAKIAADNGGEPMLLKTPAPAERAQIGFVTDIHGGVKKLNTFLSKMKDADMLVMNGDMDDWLQTREDIIERFMKHVAAAAGGSKRVYYARGNHECRGRLAEAFSQYAPFGGNRTYCGFRAGPAYCLILDSCEMSADNHPTNGGFIDLINWQKREAQWLAEEIKKPEFKNAPFRIVFQHIPIYTEDKFMHNKRGSRMNAYNTFRKELFYDNILSRANIDLMVNGHTHKYGWAPKVEGLNFPVFICSNMEGAVFDIDSKKITIRIFNAAGNPAREVITVASKRD